MNRHNKLRYLIAASLLAMLVSVFSFASSPAAAATASGKALIIRTQSRTTDNGTTSYNVLLKMDAKGNTSATNTPAAIGKAGMVPFFGAGKPIYAFITPANRLEVIDLASSKDTLYPLPALPNSLKDGNQPAAILNSFAVATDLHHLLLSFGEYEYNIIYMLDLNTGAYSLIPVKVAQTSYLDIVGQSPADGRIYAHVAVPRDGPPGTVVSFDLQGNMKYIEAQAVPPKYQRAGRIAISPAGKYLYYTAQDPDQATPAQDGPGLDANVIIRYRISDGTTQVIARTAPGNLIGDFTLTSSGPYITYSEIVPTPYKPGDFSWKAQRTLIEQVNLSTFAAPQTLTTATNSDIYHLLWCGNSLYYAGVVEASGAIVQSYSPTTHKTYQATGQLLGCAP